jgi:glycosyltransferase involved in cell wall biosynthesis
MARVLQVAAVDYQVRHFLLPLIRTLRSRGHEVAVACRDGKLLDGARAEGIQILDVPFARSLLDVRAHAAATAALRRLLRASRWDLVHAHYPVAGQIGRLVARAEGVARIAYTSHGYSFLKPSNPALRAAMFAAEWAASRCQTTLFTQSTEEARLAERLGLAPEGGAIAIGNGVDPAIFHPAPPGDPARAALRAALGAGPADCVAVIVARFAAHKGHADLFAAVQDVPGTHLWVVGERLPSDRGDGLDALIEAARRDLGPRLRLLGERQDVPDILRAADLFCLPSRFEGMPRSVVEAMMTGLPVIGTGIRGTREEVVPGRTGLLVPVGDVPALRAAIAGLAADPTLRAAMGKAGLARARELYQETQVIRRQLDALDL